MNLPIKTSADFQLPEIQTLSSPYRDEALQHELDQVAGSQQPGTAEAPITSGYPSIDTNQMRFGQGAVNGSQNVFPASPPYMATPAAGSWYGTPAPDWGAGLEEKSQYSIGYQQTDAYLSTISDSLQQDDGQPAFVPPQSQAIPSSSYPSPHVALRSQADNPYMRPPEVPITPAVAMDRLPQHPDSNTFASAPSYERQTTYDQQTPPTHADVYSSDVQKQAWNEVMESYQPEVRIPTREQLSEMSATIEFARHHVGDARPDEVGKINLFDGGVGEWR